MQIAYDQIDWHCINLRQSVSRWEKMSGRAAAAGIKLHRFEALTHADYSGPSANLAAMATRPRHFKGLVGNYLSHLALTKMATSSSRILGVLEDDAILCDDFQLRLKYIEKNFAREWDVFYLGAMYSVRQPVWHAYDIGRDFELTDVKYIHRVFGLPCDHAYLINPASATKLYELCLENMYRANAHDSCMCQLQPALRCFAFVPGCAIQEDGWSDVGNAPSEYAALFAFLGPHIFAERLSDFDYDNYDWAAGRNGLHSPTQKEAE